MMAKGRANRSGNNGADELFVFARFHARKGRENSVSALLNEEVKAARTDPGCLSHQAYRSTRDPSLFYIHSRWSDEAAFEAHLKIRHTIRFAERVEPLLDHDLQVVRTRSLQTDIAPTP
jgi:quinol monooxygenase YgiN